MRPSRPVPSAMILLGLAALSAAGGAASFGFGVDCIMQPEPGVDCAVLVALVPLVTLPLSLGLALIGAARAGWLVRANAEDAEREHDGNEAADE